MILGVFLVLIGLSIILKAVFHIDLPLVRIAIAAFFIYLGVKILVGDKHWHHEPDWEGAQSNAIFSEQQFKPKGASPSQEYNIVFGKGVVDLTQAQRDVSGPTHVLVNAIFGTGVVYVDPTRPVFVKGQAVFGDVTLPNENSVNFGTLHYRSPSSVESSQAIHIDGSAVFGSLRFVEKASS